MKQRPIAADGNDNVYMFRELRLIDDRYAGYRVRTAGLFCCKDFGAAFAKVLKHLRRRFGHARLSQTAPQANRLELLRHASVS
jgi:hypothetical protein